MLIDVAAAGPAGPALPKLRPMLFEQSAGGAIEQRRRGAVHIAEAIARFVAQRALESGRPETALAVLREGRATPQNLTLRATVLARLGRGEEATAVRRQRDALDDR